MKRHRRDLEILSDLNLTNMIDTAFTLLIVFILVSPIMKHGVDLKLPEASNEPMDTDAKTLTIVIDKSEVEGGTDAVYVDDLRVDMDTLGSLVDERKLADPKLSVVIEADQDSRYNAFAQVVSVLAERNITDVGLVTEPERDRE